MPPARPSRALCPVAPRSRTGARSPLTVAGPCRTPPAEQASPASLGVERSPRRVSAASITSPRRVARPVGPDHGHRGPAAGGMLGDLDGAAVDRLEQRRVEHGLGRAEPTGRPASSSRMRSQTSPARLRSWVTSTDGEPGSRLSRRSSATHSTWWRRSRCAVGSSSTRRRGSLGERPRQHARAGARRRTAASSGSPASASRRPAAIAAPRRRPVLARLEEAAGPVREPAHQDQLLHRVGKAARHVLRRPPRRACATAARGKRGESARPRARSARTRARAPREQPDQRGLAGGVRADHADDLAGRDGEGTGRGSRRLRAAARPPARGAGYAKRDAAARRAARSRRQPPHAACAAGRRRTAPRRTT